MRGDGSLSYITACCRLMGAGPRAGIQWVQASRNASGPGTQVKGIIMLKWAIIFAVIAAIAGVLGFSGIAAGAAGIAKLLFVLCLVVFLVLVALAVIGVGALKR